MKITDGFIDSHAHLVHEDLIGDLADILTRARAESVTGFIVPATDVRSAEAALELAARESNVRVGVGIHPHDVAKAGTDDLETIRTLVSDSKVVAIGEIGLDYFYDFAPAELQRQYFADQLMIATEQDLPIIVHTRESMEEAITMVRDHVSRHASWCSDSTGGRRGVFHCFTGTEQQARELFQLGFFVSFPGILTFKNSPVLGLFRSLDMERVLLETDAPYMAPVPVRGKRNEPAYMIHTARKMAELTSRTIDQIADTTRAHTSHLFQLV